MTPRVEEGKSAGIAEHRRIGHGDRTIRIWIYDALDPSRHPEGLSRLNRVLVLLIVASIIVCVLETEPGIVRGREPVFIVLELFFGIVFAVEYVLRLWTIVENPAFSKPVTGRLRWILTPSALIDLLAWAPAVFLSGLAPTYMLRLLRVLRIVRLAKLGRLSHAWSIIGHAVAARRFELLLTFSAGVFVVLLAATCLYLVEGTLQPEKFGSIPRAAWWAIVTLTTIGYGDVAPITPLGKAFASLTAVAGIGLIAAPTGILAAAFSEAFQLYKEDLSRRHRD